MRCAIHSTLPMMAVMSPIALGGALHKKLISSISSCMFLLSCFIAIFVITAIGQVDLLLLLNSVAESVQAQRYLAPQFSFLL